MYFNTPCIHIYFVSRRDAARIKIIIGALSHICIYHPNDYFTPLCSESALFCFSSFFFFFFLRTLARSVIAVAATAAADVRINNSARIFTRTRKDPKTPLLKQRGYPKRNHLNYQILTHALSNWIGITEKCRIERLNAWYTR